jgi:DNA-binding response OmpR family regulator
MKRIRLIDHDDPRRATRVLLLRNTGYEVVTANRFEDVEGLFREAGFDLIIVETKDVKKASIAYGERLRGLHPELPILMLSDTGLFLPKEVLLSRKRARYCAHLRPRGLAPSD